MKGYKIQLGYFGKQMGKAIEKRAIMLFQNFDKNRIFDKNRTSN